MTGDTGPGQAELRDMVEDTERLRRRARSDRRASSVPLLVFGVLTLAGAVIGDNPQAWFYWRSRRRAASSRRGGGTAGRRCAPASAPVRAPICP